MADKYQRYLNSTPSVFRPFDGTDVRANEWLSTVPNPIINALLFGFATGDQEVSEALQETKASLFVKTAENQFLDVLGSSFGVARPANLGLPDAAFRELIPPLSLQAKQVRTSFYNAMDAFWGPEFSRANIGTDQVNQFDVYELRSGDVLTFQIDNRDPQQIVIRDEDLQNQGAMTITELSVLLTVNLTGVTVEIIRDPINDRQFIRLLTTTPGLRGSIQFSVDRADEVFTRAFDPRFVDFTLSDSMGDISVPPGGTFNLDTDILIQGDRRNGPIQNGDILNFQLVTSAGITLFSSIPITIDQGFQYNFGFVEMATKVTIGANPFNPGNLADADLLSFTRNVIIPEPTIFPTAKSELIGQAQRTVIYEIRPNELTIEIPAFIPSLSRGLRGSEHLHNGPLLAEIKGRTESVNYRLPVDVVNQNVTLPGGVISNNFTITNPTLLPWLTINNPSTNIFNLVGDVPADQDVDVYEPIIRHTKTQTTTVSDQPFIQATSTNPNELRFLLNPPNQRTLPEIFGNGDILVTDNNQTFTIVDFRKIVLSGLDFLEIEVAESVNTVNQGGVINTITEIRRVDNVDFPIFIRIVNDINNVEDRDIWVGSFLYDPSGLESSFTVTGQSAQIIGDTTTGGSGLTAGEVHPRITVDSGNNTLPETSGLAVVGFGSESQEQALVIYRGRANQSVIEVDPSFVFTRTHTAGTFINIVSSASPFVPDRQGDAYPVYLTSSTNAREIILEILRTLSAAGVFINFVILAPEYKYLVDNPYLITDDPPTS